MTLLTKEAFKSIQDLNTKIVEFPELNISVKIKKLSALLLNQYLEGSKDASGTLSMALLIALSVVDEQDELVFSAENSEDLQLILSKSAETIRKLFDEINLLNNPNQGIEVKEQAKNSPETGAEDLPSA